MKEISIKLRREAAKCFVGFAEQLEKEGVDRHDILRSFDNFVRRKAIKYYNKKRRPRRLNEIELNLKQSESKIEFIFADLLSNNGIQYQQQYKIGRYRADFLISEFLVVEIDGPQHNRAYHIERDKNRDAYIRKMGYKIIRIPAWIIPISEKAVMDEIKEVIKKSQE